MPLGAIALYAISYGTLRWVRPEIINTNDGPIQAFKWTYYPLRYIDADRPDYFSAARSGWLKVKIDWINPGNGYLYFTWSSLERRAGVSSRIPDFREGILAGFSEGDEAWVHFTHTLVTWDDFESRIIPLIDRIQTVPNKAMEPIPVNVTVPASAGTAPFTSMAHLER